MTHAVKRTNPKGQAFIGTCYLCGKQGLTITQAMTDDCPNTRNLTQDEALLEALEDSNG